MPETPQLYLGLESESEEAATGFQGVLNQLRESATSTYLIGNEFERLMKQYLSIDPLYKERFTDVYLWKEWAALHTEYDGVDIGIDLVARESNGEYCAIQCKCFAEDTRVSKGQIDSFISASAGELFTKRILVHTGAELGPNVRSTLSMSMRYFGASGLQPSVTQQRDKSTIEIGVDLCLDNGASFNFIMGSIVMSVQVVDVVLFSSVRILGVSYQKYNGDQSNLRVGLTAIPTAFLYVLPIVHQSRNAVERVVSVPSQG